MAEAMTDLTRKDSLFSSGLPLLTDEKANAVLCTKKERIGYTKKKYYSDFVCRFSLLRLSCFPFLVNSSFFPFSLFFFFLLVYFLLYSFLYRPSSFRSFLIFGFLSHAVTKVVYVRLGKFCLEYRLHRSLRTPFSSESGRDSRHLRANHAQLRARPAVFRSTTSK